MRRGHSIDVVLSLVLFCLFAGSVLMVLMLGVQSYQGVVQSMEESYHERTCLQYIATKVNHYSGENAVTVTDYGDGSALALGETIGGSEYVTYIYTYEGNMMELFCASDVELDPSAGFKIMGVEGLDFTAITDDLIHITCSSSSGTATVYVTVHGGEGAGA